MSEIFSFTCYINPPTKNEKEKLRVWSSKKNRYVYIVNPDYRNTWNLIKDKLYLARYKMTYAQFKTITPKDRNQLRKSLYNDKVSLTIHNGFRRMDTSAFLHEIEDQLEGVVYKNDNQIKHVSIDKHDECEKEFFKVIVEKME